MEMTNTSIAAICITFVCLLITESILNYCEWCFLFQKVKKIEMPVSPHFRI